MFILCSNCDFKYLVNSADLKPDGRLVECANCGHQWFQDLKNEETYSSVPSSKENNSDINIEINKSIYNEKDKVKNLPSTVVRKEEPSTRNSLIVIILILDIELVIQIIF